MTNPVFLQKVFVFLGALYLLAFGTTLLVRSQTRKSVLSTVSADVDSFLFEELEEMGTRIHLQDFHRVEFKDGRPIWEVRAKDADYYAQEKVTHVTESSVVVYREDRSTVRISSSSAKLYLTEQSIQRAELQGAVNVALSDSLLVSADLATYDSASREISAPGRVKIAGQGFEVSGSRFRLAIDEQVAKLGEAVYSYFTPNAKVPANGRDALL